MLNKIDIQALIGEPVVYHKTITTTGNLPTIKESAIRQDGKVYTGRRHYNIIHAMVNEFGVKPPVRGEQGFVTDGGVFLTREEAAQVALNCGQIEKLKLHTTELFSEDLY